MTVCYHSGHLLWGNSSVIEQTLLLALYGNYTGSERNNIRIAIKSTLDLAYQPEEMHYLYSTFTSTLHVVSGITGRNVKQA